MKKNKQINLLNSSIFLVAITLIVALVVLNQFLISITGFAVSGSGFVGEIKLSEGFTYGSKTTLKPIPLATGEQPRMAGYRAIVKPLPTISDLPMKPSTGDTVQDLINNIIPTGTPWYGAEAGVSFDSAEPAARLWGNARTLTLTPEQEARWGRIVNSFTCDYCCGSPQQPTIITNCGCAHAQGALGMAKWFIKYYGDKYSDEEIYGEMSRWYAAWYPKPTIKRIVQEMSV